MDSIRTNDDWKTTMERKRLEEERQDREKRRKQHPHRPVPTAPEVRGYYDDDEDISVARNITPMYVGGMSSPAELPEHNKSLNSNMITEVVPPVGSVNGPGSKIWEEKYGTH